MTLVYVAFGAGLLSLAVAAALRGARGALSVYVGGLILAGLIWPGFMAFAALRFGVPSEGFAYARDHGLFATLSVGGAWAVVALPVLIIACSLVWHFRHRRAHGA